MNVKGNGKIIQRAHLIAQHCLRRIDEEVLFSDLVSLFFEMQDDSIGDESIRRAAYHLKNNLCPRGFEVSISQKRGTVKLSPIQLPEFLKRTTEYPEIKAGMGAVFWKWLLNVRSDQEFEYTVVAQDRIAAKLAVLREKSVLSLIADAGSTTTANIRALLDVVSIPIKRASLVDGQWRFVTPILITNSLPIASMVSESKHADRIELRLVGGTFHPSLSSICGALTEQCIQSWGGWKADLGLIGATGCWADPSGPLGFACDRAEEARLKADLLKMAYFRGTLFHSGKLKASPVGHLFAPLSSGELDFVVTDDGKALGCESAVERFCYEAETARVAVVLLKTTAPQKGTAPRVSSSPQTTTFQGKPA